MRNPPKLDQRNSYAEPEYIYYHPEWGSVVITRAMISLVLAGMKIPNNLDDERSATQRFLLSNHEETPSRRWTSSFSSVNLASRFTTLTDCERHLFGTAQSPDWETSWLSARDRNDPDTPRNMYGKRISG